MCVSLCVWSVCLFVSVSTVLMCECRCGLSHCTCVEVRGQPVVIRSLDNLLEVEVSIAFLFTACEPLGIPLSLPTHLNTRAPGFQTHSSTPSFHVHSGGSNSGLHVVICCAWFTETFLQLLNYSKKELVFILKNLTGGTKMVKKRKTLNLELITYDRLPTPRLACCCVFL